MRRFLAKIVLFSVSLAALLLGLETVVTSTTAWRRYEDPRARILWDGGFDGSRIVLLGDSVFASLYVDSLSDTVSARLEAHSGQQVFPGALNGARPPDVLAAAVHVAAEWRAGTTVFIDLPPTRFVESLAEEPPTGNFSDTFLIRYGIDADGDGVFRQLRAGVYHRLLGPFFAVRTRRALANLVNQPGQPEWMRNRVWTQKGEVARERYEFFERNLVIDASPRPFGWLTKIQKTLEGAGMRPVFVLTPLNEGLIRSFASRHPADTVLRHLRGIVVAVRAHLEQNGAAVIDITDGVPVNCFFDLVHPNACGDALIATTLVNWIDEHVQP